MRQGDVLLVRRELKPGRYAVEETLVVAHGEATGHTHRLEGNVLIVQDTSVNPPARYIEVREGGGTLVHEEHGAIALTEPGTYEIVRQREYVPPAPKQQPVTRWVAD